MGIEQGLREATRFAAKNQGIAGAEGGVPMCNAGFGREEPERGMRVGFKPCLPRGPEARGTLVPIVHSGAAQGAVVEREAKRLDEMELRASGAAKAGDVACVWRDFGLD